MFIIVFVCMLTQGFEVREYVTSKWVTTELQNVDMKSASSTMFWKLFKYIGGENEASA